GSRLNAALDWFASGSTALNLRYRYADEPVADNPGALDLTELAVSRRSAPSANITRDAGKDVAQHQFSVTVKHFTEDGTVFEATVFRFTRSLDNPLASNNWNLIDRRAGGARAQASHPVGDRGAKFTAGLDLQTLRDDRANYTPVPAVGPVTDTTVRQRERVTEVGPFAELTWPMGTRFQWTASARYDAIHFEVDDRLLDDGDNSGERTMSSLSGGLGLSAAVARGFAPYANISTSFETPTTTELAVTQSGVGGFNDSLGPQRSVSLELGGRGALGTAFSWSAAYFLVRTTDALVPYAEAGGRSFFRNAGETRNRGLEFGFGWKASSHLTLLGAWTHADYRFRDYVAITNAGADTTDLSGRRLPGVPTEFLRLSLRATLGRGVWVDVDHTLSGEMYADDANTEQVDGWGAGVSNVRFGWDGTLGTLRIAPFAAVNNAWDRTYIGSVTANGFGGRVYEPSPGRNYYVGLEIGWRRE
ncbi:MAG TPA: TonB-dependent receptor, partial [Gemmatimonadales bacterium]|nr:TonB-dependent receptor [Gemmatimonadales bacterium]